MNIQYDQCVDNQSLAENYLTNATHFNTPEEDKSIQRFKWIAGSPKKGALVLAALSFLFAATLIKVTLFALSIIGLMTANPLVVAPVGMAFLVVGAATPAALLSLILKAKQSSVLQNYSYFEKLKEEELATKGLTQERHSFNQAVIGSFQEVVKEITRAADTKNCEPCASRAKELFFGKVKEIYGDTLTEEQLERCKMFQTRLEYVAIAFGNASLLAREKAKLTSPA